MMKLVKQLFLVAAIVVGVSISASAQSNDNKNPPPKKDPPVIKIEDKPRDKPKEEKPKEEKKKPEMALLNVLRDDEVV